MDDDSIDADELKRTALCNLLEPHATRGGAGASKDAVPGTLDACVQAWLTAWALPDHICQQALEASRDIWEQGGVPESVQQCAAWEAAAGKAAEAMAEAGDEDELGGSEAEGKTGGEGVTVDWGSSSSSSESDGGTGGAASRPVRDLRSTNKYDPADEDKRPQRLTATRRELARVRCARCVAPRCVALLTLPMRPRCAALRCARVAQALQVRAILAQNRG